MPRKPRLFSPSLLLVLALILILILPSCSLVPTQIPTSSPFPTNTLPKPSPTIVLPTQTPYVITATSGETTTPTSSQGVFFVSLEEAGYFHLFAYSPQTLPLTRLTSDSWDDITPALSPNGNQLVFASRRNGYWDLFLMDLSGGGSTRLTDTPDFDAAPSWSPDGAFIAYESYQNHNLDIYLKSVSDPGQSPFQLTQDPASDYSPAWSPLGRTIAFISNRTGEPEVWIADLDHAGTFTDVSNNPNMIEAHPIWSPDGNKLAWAATDPTSGLTNIYFWDSTNKDSPISWAGSGDWPVWLSNDILASRLTAPNHTFITGYTISGSLSIPPVLLPGTLDGLSYGTTSAPFPGSFIAAAQVTVPAPFVSATNPQANVPSGRAQLEPLENVTTAYPQLNEMAVPSFQALRAQVIDQAGWDALANLENAFVPLTTPLDPGLGEDWLYTGRAFTLNPLLIQAKWMTVVREDFGEQVYWRIFLYTAAQDGSQGMPLTQIPWDFSARTTSSTAYENGGQLMKTIPAGYWLDLTSLASQYGWKRLPSLTNWRTYYAGAHFNELIFPQNLDWRNSMLQIYPPEVLVTPTLLIPSTRTPTRTPLYYRSPTPIKTPTMHPTSTP
jgi:TolB protein